MVAIVNVVRHLPIPNVGAVGDLGRACGSCLVVRRAGDGRAGRGHQADRGDRSRIRQSIVAICREGVQFFELDHGATQQESTSGTWSGAHLRCRLDLTTQSAGEALVEHGLDTSRPVLFVVEGVTMYLDERIVRDQLGGLAKSSAVASRLAVDFYPPRAAGTSLNHRQNRLQRLARIGSAETLRLTIDRPAPWISLLDRVGR